VPTKFLLTLLIAMCTHFRTGQHKPSAFDLKAQQRSLNRFVKEYNHVRPHEALGMKTPADCHDFSTRPYPEKIPNYDYPSTMKVTLVLKSRETEFGGYFTEKFF